MRKRLITHLTILLLASLLVSASFILVPAAVGSGQSDQLDLIESLLEELSNEISNRTKYPVEAFEHKNEGSVEGKRGALRNKIGAVINQIEAGAFEGALNKLTNDIKEKIEEWIDDPWASILIGMVETIIDVIKGILPPLQPPEADFFFTPETPLAGEAVTFNASESHDPDGYIVSYLWNFGDGNITTVSNSIIIHMYATYGTYTVTLNVTDNDGLTDTESEEIEVIVHPTASFTYSPIAAMVGEVVTFNASSSTPNGGEIVRYAWDLGDNTIRFGDIVTHAYNAEGTYTVVLNVTDSEGLWDIATANITVYFVVIDTEPPTIVEVLQYPETPNYDEPVTVTANVTDDEGSGIESVILCYSIDAITWINITMSPMDNGLYSAEIPPKPYNTVVIYFIYANDKAGNSAVSRPFFYRVVDLHPPVISGVEHAPTFPNYDETVTVFADVTEPPNASKVGFVILSYWDGSAWANITMKLVGIRCNVAIPVLPYETEVQYRVYASDNAWNWAVSGLHVYQVTDNIPPSLDTPTWDPVEPFAEEQVNVSVSVSEPLGASGVKNVTLWHNATGEWQSVECEQSADGNWTATIPGASGGVTVAFYVESYDNAGNRAVTTTYDYKAKEEVGAVWPLAMLGAIGLGIAALTATLLYALYRRRKRGRSAANPGNKPKPIVTLYVPAKILSQIELKPLKRRKS